MRPTPLRTVLPLSIIVILAACSTLPAETSVPALSATQTSAPTITPRPTNTPRPTVTPTPSTNITTIGNPPARYYTAMSWDAFHNQALLIGGSDMDTHSDVWAFSGEEPVWTQLTTDEIGPPRELHSMTWDETGRRILLFGGDGKGIGNQVKNELWSFDPASKTWEQLQPQGAIPPVRNVHGTTWDSQRELMWIFGGKSGNFDEGLNDLWKYDPAANRWEQIPRSDPWPPPRQDLSLLFIPLDGKLYMHGGWTASDHGANFFNDLWQFDPDTATWQEMSAPEQNRMRHAAVWDPIREQMLIFGGCCGPKLWFNDVWGYDPRRDDWVEYKASGELPSARQRFGYTWDPIRGQMLIFGGISYCFFQNDLWGFDPAAKRWYRYYADDADSFVREGHSLMIDEERNRLILFGGCDGGSLSNEIWTYDLNASTGWQLEAVNGSSPPDPRTDHTAVYDATNDRLYILGGQSEEGVVNDLWSYDFAAQAWVGHESSQLASRTSAVSVWDSNLNRVLFFGGVNPYGIGFLDDLWSLDTQTNELTEIPTAGTGPSQRQRAKAAYDPISGTTYIYGGWSQAANLSKRLRTDLWAYHPDSGWTQLSSRGPNFRDLPSLVLDETGQRLLLYGGYNEFPQTSNEPIFLNEVWQFDLANGKWELLPAEGDLPIGRMRHGAVWDSAQNRMIIFGGYGGQFVSSLYAYYPDRGVWELLSP
jgi:N-acetylneuraminic acid mutarotase